MKSLILFLLMIASPATFAIKAKMKPLEQRVREAEVIFAGKLVNKVIDGEWVRAELEVADPLKNSKKGEEIKVTWRLKLGERKLYDIKPNSQGIALLKEKHEGRYWLRADKFENLEKSALVKGIIKLQKEPLPQAVPK